MPPAIRSTRSSARSTTLPGHAGVDVKPNIVKEEVKDVKSEAITTPARKKRKANAAAQDEDVKPTIASGYLDRPERPVIATPAKKENIPQTPAKSEGDTPKPKSSTKTSKYKLMPGQTPFPDWEAPTPEQCADVVERLESWHGKHEAPKVIPAPSLESSGCGEVPSILDALIRTLLSAATNRRNSSAAFRNIVENYGILKEGVGQGSVNWNAVRERSENELFETIKCGGLAKNKSKNIKAILDMVYEENIERANALEKTTDPSDDTKPSITGADKATQEEKTGEIERSKQHVLSLDHLHAFSKDEAMEALLRFPGVGVKTSSCTLLFCLSRASFAVDTHVHRLCAWLGWIPPKATRDQAFFHLDTKIPDEHKYALHVLMWQHGVACPSCRMIPVKERREFDGKECPLKDLIEANGGWGKKAGGTPAKGKKSKATPKSKKGKRAKADSEEEEATASDSDLSDELPMKGRKSKPTPKRKGGKRARSESEEDDVTASDSELSDLD
jgi:endonuclease III